MLKKLRIVKIFGSIRIGDYFAYEGEYYQKTGLYFAFNIKRKTSRAMHSKFLVTLFEEVGTNGL